MSLVCDLPLGLCSSLLMTAFSNSQLFSIPYVPVRWLLLDKFESWRFAPHVTAPTLIIAAEHDELVPRTNTELLLSRFRNGLISFRVVSGTGHNTISSSPEYIQLLKSSN